MKHPVLPLDDTITQAHHNLTRVLVCCPCVFRFAIAGVGSDEVSEFSWVGVCLVMAAVLSQAVFFVGSQVDGFGRREGGDRRSGVKGRGQGLHSRPS